MLYHSIEENNKELRVIREISEDEVIYVLYERDVPNDGYNISKILNCFKSEDEAIKRSDSYRKCYSSIIIEPGYQTYTYIATFYTVIFENIYSSEPSSIDIKSYVCCPSNVEMEDTTTTINEFVGVSKQDNKIMVKMYDIGNNRLNRDEIISEAKERRKIFLMKQFDIK